MARLIDTTITETLRAAAVPLTSEAPVVERIGDARFVLLGEASHGTHEFYRERARITRRLIEEHGVVAVAAEADWPDAARVNRYVRGESDDATAADALGDFRRFPTWMWRNTDVVDFVEWLRGHNAALAPDAPRVGFYGLDLYSLRASMDAVLQYLDRTDTEAARRARERYACFDHYDENVQIYGLMAGSGGRSCEDDVVAQLTEMLQQAARRMADTELFDAVQNARLVKNAEAYYRSMFRDDVSSWNLRDRHMTDTLDTVAGQLAHTGSPARIVVWAHNSHLGDARATQMGQRGELNVGQLVRERHPGESVLVGFTTDHGTVTAASAWDGMAERKRVRPARPDSYEGAFHAAELPRFMLTWDDGGPVSERLRDPRLERAIGVIYRPDTERTSHYFRARLPAQFDVVLHFDETRAVEPLDRTSEWDAGEAPETFPFGV